MSMLKQMVNQLVLESSVKDSGLLEVVKKLEQKFKVHTAKGASEERIVEAESKLNRRFANDYREYLSVFGAISFGSTELTGLNVGSHVNVVDITLKEIQRNKQFPKDAVVIENTGVEGLLVLQDEHGQVYEWQHGKQGKSFQSFIAFLESVLHEVSLESDEVVADAPAVVEEPEVQEETITAEEVETVVEVTQSLESLALSMRSAEGGYNPRELALHDAAVEAQCKRLKLQPPLRPSLESIDAHGAEAETQLVLESLESYVEKLQDVAMEAICNSEIQTLSLEGFGEKLKEVLIKLWEKIQVYLRYVGNWISKHLLKALDRAEVAKVEAAYKSSGLKLNATPEEMVDSLIAYYGGTKDFGWLVEGLNKLNAMTLDDISRGKHLPVFEGLNDKIKHLTAVSNRTIDVVGYAGATSNKDALQIRDRLHKSQSTINVLKDVFGYAEQGLKQFHDGKLFSWGDYGNLVNLSKMNDGIAEVERAIKAVNNAYLNATPDRIMENVDGKWSLTENGYNAIKELKARVSEMEALHAAHAYGDLDKPASSPSTVDEIHKMAVELDGAYKSLSKLQFVRERPRSNDLPVTVLYNGRNYEHEIRGAYMKAFDSVSFTVKQIAHTGKLLEIAWKQKCALAKLNGLVSSSI